MFVFASREVSARYHAIPADTRARFENWVHIAGRTWRSDLRRKWMLGHDDGQPVLRTVRNIIGPTDIGKMSYKF